MGIVKDRRGMDLTEAETLKRGEKNTQNCTHTKKNLNDLDNHDSVITYLGPDILGCKVKWALGSINFLCSYEQS